MQLEIQEDDRQQRGRVGRAKTAEDQAVFQAMFTVVAEVGYANLTFAKVANRVGLTPSALVQRFRTKRGLLLAFLDWFQATAQAVITAALDRTPEAPLETLRTALLNWSTQLPSQPERLANLAALFPQLAGDQEIRSRIARIDRLLEEAIQGVLLSAVNKGHVKASETRLLARVLIAACRGTLIRWAVLPEGSIADRLRECLDTLLASYLPADSA